MSLFWRNNWRVVVTENGDYGVCRADEVGNRSVVAECSSEKQARQKVFTLQNGNRHLDDTETWYYD